MGQQWVQGWCKTAIVCLVLWLGVAVCWWKASRAVGGFAGSVEKPNRKKPGPDFCDRTVEDVYQAGALLKDFVLAGTPETLAEELDSFLHMQQAPKFFANCFIGCNLMEIGDVIVWLFAACSAALPAAMLC
eukprot:evm.model.scf_426.10 EVM.evm.TU.scf_426.10   scf_426:76197-76589(-)